MSQSGINIDWGQVAAVAKGALDAPQLEAFERIEKKAIAEQQLMSSRSPSDTPVAAANSPKP
jgi:hypothetical protein